MPKYLRTLLHPRLWPLRAQARVLVCLLIAAIALGVVELWARRSVAQSQADVGHHLLQTARNMADRLSKEMADRARDVVLLSQLGAIRESLDPVAARAALERLRSTLPAYAWIGLTDAQGTVIAATDDVLLGQSIAARPVFRQGRNGLWTGDVHDAVLLAQLAPKTRGEAPKFVDVAAPVRRADGSLSGVLALHLSWQWAEQLRAALRPRGASSGLELMIFSASGQLLLGPDTAAATNPSEPPPSAAPPGLSLARLNLLDEQWALERWSDGRRVPTGVATSQPSGGFAGFGWRVVARDVSPGAVLELSVVRRQLLPWAAGVGGALALVACWLIGLMIAPIDQLAQSLRNERRERGHAAYRAEGARMHRRSDVQQIAAAVAELQSTLKARDATVLRLQEKAHVDPLTGLWNRNYLEALTSKLNDAVSGHAAEFCVLCIDLDGFKPVNDRYGHDAGDQVLSQVGKRLRQVAREEDSVFRLGGDEFLILLSCPAGEGMALARQVALRVIADLQRPMTYRTLSNLRIGCSIGAAIWPHDGSTLSEVMRHADEALYAAKRAGRGQFRLHAAGAAGTASAAPAISQV